MSNISNSLFGKGKALVFGIIILLLLTSSLSPVYAGYSFNESKTMESIESESLKNNNDIIRHSFDRESFIDRYGSSEMEECYRNNPYLHRHDQHNQIMKPTVIDGEEWDIVVPDDYPTIQEAVYAAEDGERIFVRSGLYKENIQISGFYKTLHGESKYNTIIEGGGNDHVISIAEPSVLNISGFTIRNSGINNYGILVSSNYNIIQNNILENNTIGIKLQSSNGNQIWNNRIENNIETGIVLNRSHANNIAGNIITENGNNGIRFTYSSLGTSIDNNQISNHDNDGICLDESSLGNMFTRCTIEENNYGVLCTGVSDGNIFQQNKYLENSIHAFDSSRDQWDYQGLGNYWDDYTGADNNGDGIGDIPYTIPGGNNKDRYPLMSQAIMYNNIEFDKNIPSEFHKEYKSVSSIKSSNNGESEIIVPDNYQTIQEAVDHANPGDTIYVKSGIYSENINISTPDLIIYGEDKETTIIDGGGNDHVIFVNEDADGLNISGFTVESSGRHFTGLYVYSDSTVIENIIFTDCNIGIALRDNTENMVKDCEFVSNNYGIWTWMCTNSSIKDNNIRNNVLDGMALQWSTSLNIIGNNISSNLFDGILEISCSKFELFNNTIIGNNEFGIQLFSSNGNNIMGNDIELNDESGISLHKSEKNRIDENMIIDNYYGVSLWFYSSDNTIIWNTISENLCGVYQSHSSQNTISWNAITDNFWYGIDIHFGVENTIISNTITNNEGKGIFLYHTSKNAITGNTISDNEGQGIDGSNKSENNTITGNTIIGNNEDGIFIFHSSDNTIITGNTIIKNKAYGIQLGSLENISITENTIIGNNRGIRLYRISESIVIMNTITNNSKDGICLDGNYDGPTINNTIRENNVRGNNDFGIWIYTTSDKNRIYENNFIDNGNNALDYANNIWNNEKHGNYWDDYTGKDFNHDGIGDSPYLIPGGDNKDNYPLMVPFTKNAPDKPRIVDGQSNGIPGVEYEYSCSTTDPERDQIWYKWDWGDGNFSEWLGPYDSGNISTAIHSWVEMGNYNIRVKAKDIYDLESDWSDPLSITMPKSKFLNSCLYFLWEIIFDHFQILDKILQNLYSIN